MAENTISLSRRNAYYMQPLLEFPDGTFELVPKPYTRPENLEFSTYLVKQGDRLDTIAGQAYQNQDSEPSQWEWLIAEENEMENSWDLSSYVGKPIRIPSISQYKILSQNS